MIASNHFDVCWQAFHPGTPLVPLFGRLLFF